MKLDPHMAAMAVLTLGIGWVMTVAGLQKSALELRKKKRTCPSCGRHISSRTCTNCV